jgi:putative spermidine/putrescine transport system ATP-binding protein/putrescine transport system ATP-binding protein
VRAVLEVRELTKRFGPVRAVDGLSFVVAEGQSVSLLGPSGCGKTTTLRIIAGFEPPDHGAVVIDGQDMRGRRPYERNIGLVFQDYALFPHMTVEQNVAYGMRHRGVSRAEIPGRLREMLRMVKLVGFEARRPRQLSGGEQQRVALARALATRPAVLLLDEPMSNLDAKLREQVRVELREILMAARTTTILVTHDQQEAMSVADVVLVMNQGRLMQMGTAMEIYARPTSRFVADFIGRMNWFRGRAGEADASGWRALRTEEGTTLRVPADGSRAGEMYDVGVRPERVRLSPAGDSAGQAREADHTDLAGRVATVEHLGADIHVWVDLPSGQRLLAVEKNVGGAAYGPGQGVRVRFPGGSCLLLPVERAGNESG